MPSHAIAIEEPNPSTRRRDGQAEGGADGDEAARAQRHALAAHIRTGQNGGVVQLDLQRHERPARGRQLRLER